MSRRSHHNIYTQAFAHGYRRGSSREKEVIEIRWLGQRQYRTSVWYYRSELIAVILPHPEQGHWLYLASASKNKPVFDRFDALVRHFDLGIFSKGGFVPKKKGWAFFPKGAQYFVLWKGQLIFKLETDRSYNSYAGKTLSIADRLRAIVPLDFTSNPFWEKDLSWKPVEHL